VAEQPSHTWTCPSCGRRVPLRAETCHCGATRAQAEELEAAAVPVRPGPPRARTRLPPLPKDVKVLMAGSAIALVAGLAWLALGPSRPSTTPAVLGHVDVAPPPVRPSPSPTPPFKLPWWR